MNAEQLADQAVEAEDAGQAEAARVLWRQAMALKPPFKVRRRYAFFLLDQQECDEAEQELLALLDHVEDSEQALYYGYIGSCQRKSGRYEDAEHSYRKSLAIQETAPTWIFLGATLVHLGRDDEAMRCYQRALELEPDNEEAHFNLGCRYYYLEQRDLAEVQWRRAVEIDPDYALAYSQLAQVVSHRVGLERRKSGPSKERNAEAKQLLLLAVELNPSDVWVLTLLANHCWGDEQLQQADEHYQAALEAQPDFSMTHWCYGDFLSATQRDFIRAEQLLKRAIEIDPQDSFAFYNLGKHYWRLERDSEAKPLLQEAARLGHERAQELLDSLETT